MIYKKILLFILIITIFNFTGCIQPESNSQIIEMSMTYLKDKYKEEFKYKDIKTSWNKGDSHWKYSVRVIPKNNPDKEVYVSSEEGLKEFYDNYQILMWNTPREKYMKDFMQTKFGIATHFSCYFSTNDEIKNKYSVYDDPIDIIKREAHYIKNVSSSKSSSLNMNESMYMYIPIDDSINEDDITTKLLDVIKYYDEFNLYFKLNLYFGKEKINGKNNVYESGTFKEKFAEIQIDSNTIADKENLKRLIKYYKNGVIVNNLS